MKPPLRPVKFHRTNLFEMDDPQARGPMNVLMNAFRAEYPNADYMYSDRVGEFGGFFTDDRQTFRWWLKFFKSLPLPIPALEIDPETAAAINEKCKAWDESARACPPAIRFLTVRL